MLDAMNQKLPGKGTSSENAYVTHRTCQCHQCCMTWCFWRRTHRTRCFCNRFKELLLRFSSGCAEGNVKVPTLCRSTTCRVKSLVFTIKKPVNHFDSQAFVPQSRPEELYSVLYSCWTRIKGYKIYYKTRPIKGKNYNNLI